MVTPTKVVPFPWLHLLIITIWVSLTFLPAIAGEFLNWDDRTHLVENSVVKNFDLSEMFSSCVQKIYIPLTTLSFAWEYKFFGMDPVGYHINNLILHVINSLLVYWLAFRLGIGSLGALIASLVFGVHPMRVESVAWVTERKDLLYACFYLLSINGYWNYLESQKKRTLVVSYVCGVLSLLAKPMALSLPIIFLSLDWLRRREITLKVLLEKVPLIFIFVPIILMTYQWHVRNPVENVYEAVITWIWCFNFYIGKFFWPSHLSAIYYFPAPASLNNPIHIFSILSFVSVAGFFYFLREQRWVVFAFIYYLGSIFFLLRLDNLKDINFVADRFMYLPSLGFCLLLGVWLECLIKKCAISSLKKISIVILSFALIAVLSICSMEQTKVWNNSVILWTRVIDLYPTEFIAYNDRAVAFISKQRNDLALNDYDAIVKFDPDNADVYFNRGLLLQNMGQQNKAIDDFSRVIKKYPYYEKGYHSRGRSFEAIGRDDLAVEDYTRAILVTPAFVDAYISRGNVFNRRGYLNQSLKDYLRVLEINPQHLSALNNSSTIYAKLHDDKKAFEYVNRAIAVDPYFKDALYNRSVLYRRNGNFRKSLDDAVLLEKLGGQLPQNYIDELRILSRQ